MPGPEPNDGVYDEILDQQLPDQQLSELDTVHERVEKLKEELNEDSVKWLERLIELYVHAYKLRVNTEVVETIMEEEMRE